MKYNDITTIYRIMIRAYFFNEESLRNLESRIHDFAYSFRGNITQLENALKKELDWLKTNYVQKSKKKIESSHKVYENDIAEICLSLAGAFQEAGGSVPSIESLKERSAWEFIRIIAPNKIRFYCNSEEVK